MMMKSVSVVRCWS